MRRTDISAKSFHGKVRIEYYNAALHYLSTKLSIAKIYIFSDDIEWCKQNIHFPIDTMYVDNDFAGEKNEYHFILMNSCKHFIIPNSTYSWWAAWLAINPSKIVIAPKNWFSNGRIDTSDLIPEAWIRI